MNDSVLGVIAAMPAEAATCRVSRAAWSVVCAGIGGAAAARGAETLIASGARGLVSWGTAGALSAALGAGKLALYTCCVDAQTGEEFPTDPGLRARFEAWLEPLRPVACRGLTSTVPLAGIAEKAAGNVRFGCAAADMETTAIAAVARRHGVPFVAVRSIVDPAGWAIPQSALAGMDADTAAAWRVAGALLRNPTELGPLLRLAWWYRRALGTLRSAATLIENAEWSVPKHEE